ncbi:uncharacterized protein [Channa argus]|uniref:uncharacterized protein n=1 Tax=Channa argus TaxID=215402 RepID=UPI00352149B0
MYQNVILHCGNQQNGDSLNNPHWSSGLSDADSRQEPDYDVLPNRNKICGSVEMEEGVYDFPLSYRMGDTHPDQTDSIYDVPSSLLRTLSDDTLDNALAAPDDEEKQDQEEICWTI